MSFAVNYPYWYAVSTLKKLEWKFTNFYMNWYEFKQSVMKQSLEIKFILKLLVLFY